ELRGQVIVYNRLATPQRRGLSMLTASIDAPRVEPFTLSPQERQGMITGVVTDARTGAPIATAQVSVPTLEIGALTGSNGRYLILNVPAGTHTVEVVRIG